MSTQRPIITFHVTVTTHASAEEVYEVLADLNTHLIWAGEQAPMKQFRLLSMQAPERAATVGTEFSSTGSASKNGRSTFRDHSVVVEAEAGARFGFDTDAHLSRPRAKTWHCRFSHRYSIANRDGTTTVSYVCEVRPQNYIAYWLRPWFRPMVRASVQRAHKRHMENLVRMAESVRASR